MMCDRFFAGLGLKDSNLIREVAVSISMSTYTPVNYWLSLPVLELGSWIKTVEKVNNKGK
jgi:hypothetical protein